MVGVFDRFFIFFVVLRSFYSGFFRVRIGEFRYEESVIGFVVGSEEESLVVIIRLFRVEGSYRFFDV